MPLLVDPEVAGELGDVLVGVTAVQRVFVGHGGGVDVVVQEAAGGLQVLLPVGPKGMEVGQALVHAPVLPGDVDVPHPVELLLAQGRHPAVDPVPDAGQHREGLFVPGVNVGVDEARHDLVEGVVGRPDALTPPVQRELLQPDELCLGIGGEKSRMPASVRGGDDRRVPALPGGIHRGGAVGFVETVPGHVPAPDASSGRVHQGTDLGLRKAPAEDLELVQ